MPRHALIRPGPQHPTIEVHALVKHAVGVAAWWSVRGAQALWHSTGHRVECTIQTKKWVGTHRFADSAHVWLLQMVAGVHGNTARYIETDVK